MSDYILPEGNYTDLDENVAMQFSYSSIAAVPVNVNGNDDDRRRVTRPNVAQQQKFALQRCSWFQLAKVSQ